MFFSENNLKGFDSEKHIGNVQVSETDGIFIWSTPFFISQRNVNPRPLKLKKELPLI